jgi:hypothetical protein
MAKKRPGQYVGKAGPIATGSAADAKQANKGRGGPYPHEEWKVPGEAPPDKSARPLTSTAPGSSDYALSGPLADRVPKMRVPQGEQTGSIPPKSHGGSE